MLHRGLRIGRRILYLSLCVVLLASRPADAQEAGKSESVGESICRLIESSARANRIPVAYLTRLIWQESSFRPDVTSRAGAKGVAQFMPGTARERGLADPFDPEQAIPAAAALLSDFRTQFGNLGLAAAAYNGGSGRVTAWLAGRGGLLGETRDYVARITGRSAEDWSADRDRAAPTAPSADPEPGCLQVVAEIRQQRGPATSILAEGAVAPWGVQLAGGFSKAIALAAFDRNRARLASVLGDVQPMILGSRLRNRGRTTFYRIRLPAPTRLEANKLCGRIRSASGACVVLRT